ncbi:MAG: methylenetetrahydrofolate reductase [NAD(P)H] [Lachnospiraceae bacterium]|nr:methylenetetrahydrofolate reductase [NAD(P)H] [Lachnospiraceae bacterium]
MKISELLAKKEPTLSFEVFPPKTSDKYDSVEYATREIAKLKPDFMSVTYGAGGGTSAYTTAIAKDLQDNYGVTTLAHITCVSSSRATVFSQLDRLKAAGIENVLSLRGDIPKDGVVSEDYRYASELTRDIKDYGGFCIGGACYPEGHVESANQREDILHVKEKVEAGCEFLTTQMFFDNSILYNYLYKIREAGINVPIIAGIMPITNAKQLGRSVALSGTNVPQRFRAIVDRFGDKPEAMKQAGIAYATDQIIDLLANGVNAIHVYSMNKPDVAAKIQENLSEIIPSAKKAVF